MRWTATALILLIAIGAAQAAAAEAPVLNLSPISPDEFPVLERRVGDSSCRTDEERLAFRHSILGDLPPEGFVPPEGVLGSRLCEIPLNPCGMNELEPLCEDGYIDEFNGGCNSSPEIFQRLDPYFGPIIVNGKSGFYNAQSTRDTDWYEFQLTQATDIVLTGVAEFDMQLLIIDGNIGCSSPTILFQSLVLECEEAVIAEYLPAGTYWIWVGCQFTDFTVPCDADYTFTLEGLFAADDCADACPPGGMIEGEPVCFPSYDDFYNGGCNFYPSEFQPIAPSDDIIFVCGQGGVYPHGEYPYAVCYRDMDWYQFELDEPRHVEFCGIAGFYYMFQLLAGGDCGSYTVVDYWYHGPCDVMCADYELEPGVYWIIFAAGYWEPIDCGRSYILTIDGYTTPVEQKSWGAVKALYR